MKATLKAYVDLTRLQFFFVWPILFCSGLFLSLRSYGGFSWSLIARASLIGLLGFEAGFVLNDYVDRELDRGDVEFDKLTKYWRLFGKRPIAAGLISPNHALLLFIILVAATSILITTLPYPHSIYVFIIMTYSYCAEYYYQVKKRQQSFPIAQLLGRTDFTLFPIAGYLSNGNPGMTPLLYLLFFYPFAIAHLGVNDIVDIANDRAKGLKTIPVLFGMKGTTYWILLFTVMHYLSGAFFLKMLGTTALAGFSLGFVLLAIANYVLLKEKSAETGLRVLPLFHVTMLIYAGSIILNSIM
ncbi:MAG: UbiA family prenyltransferase [archaeon]